MTIPKNIIFCNKNDNIDIFINKNPYIINKKIHYVANGYEFNPPFFEIIILFDTVKTTEQDLKLLWNMVLINGFLIIPNNKFNFFKDTNDIVVETKTYKNYVMIHKKNNFVYNPDDKWRIIDFMIMSFQKCGTSACATNIGKHPDIFMAKEEIHFFDKFWINGIKWYKSHFDYSKKMIGEKTPDYGYLEWNLPMIQQINPFLKIILLIRNPIDRAFSSYNMEKTTWGETKSFEECIEEEKKYRMNEITNLHNGTKHHLQKGLYFKQITELLLYFPRQNIIILQSEIIKNNMQEEYNKIYEFLNLKKIYDINYTEERVGNYNDKINPKTYDSLIDFYKEDVKSLEDFIGYKTNWKGF